MSAAFHPSDDLLASYAAGSLDEATGLLIASHLTLCPACRDTVDRAEVVGGALLDSLVPDDTAMAPVSADALARVLSRLDDPLPVPHRAPPPSAPQAQAGAAAEGLPAPLRQYLGGGLDTVRWTRLARGLEQSLVVDSGRVRARLYRIAPGVTIPDHTHHGSELTLVLHGGFSDLNGHYGRGDVASADSTVSHRPSADPDGPCICLAVTDAPLRLNGWVGRLISPFLNL